MGRKSSREDSQGRGLKSNQRVGKKGTKAVLPESKELFEKVFQSQMDAIFILDSAKPPRIIDCNPAAQVIFGYSRNEMVGRTTQFLHVDRKGLKNFQKQLYPQIEGQGFFHFSDFMMKRKRGETFPSEHTVVPLNDEQGERTGWVSIIRDITERQRVEDALRRSEETYRLVSERTSDLISIITFMEEPSYVYVSPSHRDVLGYDPQDLIGKSPFGFIHPDDGKKLFPLFQDYLLARSEILSTGGGKRPTERILYRLKDARGNWRCLETTGDLLDHDHVLFISRDVTEKRESEEKYRLLAETAREMILTLDLDGKINYANKAATEVSGYLEQELMGRKVTEFLPPNQLPLFDEQMKRRIAGDRESFLYETEFIRKDGKRIVAEVSSSPVIQHELLAGILITARDITQRKHVERALVESEEKYRLLVENANEAIFILQEGRVEFPNRWAREIGRYLGVDLQNTPFTEYIHPLDRDLVTGRHRRRMSGQQLPDTYSFRLIGMENREMWVELSAVLITWEGKPATLNFMRDITRQKEIEARLQQVLRMEALGTLAAGIAHDFNNLLMGIQGRISLMLLNLETSHPHYRDLREMESIVGSGSDLTKQLLGFTRGGRYQVKPVNINDLINETARLFGRARKPIQIRRRLRRDVWPVEIDRGQVGQVLLNLLVNASEAMPEGGHLYLQTRNVILNEDFVAPHGVPAGRFVKITVKDTGAGMDERTLQRVFEPFFTTKEMGRGTGLGLASAYGIVRNHGGIIVASSKPGAGTVFEIYLPASEKEVLEEAPSPLGAIPGGTETILLVEDEPRVLDICERFLKKSGYSVLPARKGSDAVKIFETQKEKIDMVVLDMIMSDMSGEEVLDRLKTSDPDVKVLVSTGYAIQEEETRLASGHRVNFIQKPYSFRTLAREIRRILQ